MGGSFMKAGRVPVAAIFVAALSIGCGREVQQPAASKAAEESGAGRLKVAFVYNGPVGDGGWTYAHEQGRKMLEAELGAQVQTSVVENVAEGPGAEKVFRDLAAQGNKLIFGTTYGYKEAMLKVAQEHPDVRFEHATGNATAANLSSYEARTYEGAYLAGVIAGKVSKSNKLGFVASVPIPEVFRNINAFTLGAQSVNPDIRTHVAWVQEWINPDKERAAALALIEQGVDVLIQNTDSSAVLQAAQEKGVMAFGWDSDMTRYGPKAHLGSAVIDWAPYYKDVVRSVIDGNWTPKSTWLGARQNMVRIASPNPELPHELLLFIGERLHALKSGKLHPFQGPLTDREGKTIAVEGEALDDEALRRMNYFVNGVSGPMK